MSRSNMAALKGKRIVFTGIFMGYSRTPQGRNVALIRCIMVAGQTLTDHIWIHRSKQMKYLNLMRFDHIEFEGEVRAYKHGVNQDKEADFGIERIKGVRKL